MFRHLLLACAVTLGAVACSLPTEDTAEDEEELTGNAPWHRESDLAAPAEQAKLVAYFDAHAERGSFVSDHPKVRATRQGSNVDIAYAIVRARRERGAIVVANGRTESFSHYAEFVYDLHRRGWTLYLLDHRGQGHSSRLVDYATVGDREYQKGHIDDFDDYVDDYTKFVDTVVLPDRAGKPRKLHALGHSMGGAITTLYAERRPETFTSIALSSPMHQIEGSGLKLGFAGVVNTFASASYALGYGPRNDAEPFENNGLTTSRARFAAKTAVWAHDASTKVGGPTYGWISRANGATREIRRNAGAITSPVLLLEGASDEVVAPEGHKAVCDGINAAHPAGCKLVVLDRSEHEPLIETDAIRGRALDEITRFYLAH